MIATELMQIVRYDIRFSILCGEEAKKLTPSALQSKLGAWPPYVWHTYSCSHSHTDTSHPPLMFVPMPVSFSSFPRMRTLLKFLTCNVGTSGLVPMEAFRPGPRVSPWQPLDALPSSLSLVSKHSLAYHMHVLFIHVFVLSKIWPHCVGVTPEKKNKIYPLRESGYCGSLEKFTYFTHSIFWWCQSQRICLFKNSHTHIKKCWGSQALSF